MNTEVTATLENWVIADCSPEEVLVFGDCYADIHGRFLNGTFIKTSGARKDINEFNEGSIVKTRNSSYKLGKPHPDMTGEEALTKFHTGFNNIEDIREFNRIHGL